MNIKKLFPDKGESRKGIVDFLDRKGFYIVLILCIAIVGATAVFVTTHNVRPTELKSDNDKIIPEEVGNKVPVQSSVSSVASADQKAASAVKPAATGTNSKQNEQKKESINSAPDSSNKATAAPKAAETSKAPQLIMPVFGEVTTAFAHSNLVYSKTLDEWRAHDGEDIAAERGTPVKATADGVISDIKNDPRLGIVVVIEHANGVKTVYANLASDDMVSVNQKVKQNDVIGCVGNTANFEIAEQSHLHFEVWKNNEPVNPALYLPKKEQ